MNGKIRVGSRIWKAFGVLSGGFLWKIFDGEEEAPARDVGGCLYIPRGRQGGTRMLPSKLCILKCVGTRANTYVC